MFGPLFGFINNIIFFFVGHNTKTTDREKRRNIKFIDILVTYLTITVSVRLSISCPTAINFTSFFFPFSVRLVYELHDSLQSHAFEFYNLFLSPVALLHLTLNRLRSCIISKNSKRKKKWSINSNYQIFSFLYLRTRFKSFLCPTYTQLHYFEVVFIRHLLFVLLFFRFTVVFFGSNSIERRKDLLRAHHFLITLTFNILRHIPLFFCFCVYFHLVLLRFFFSFLSSEKRAADVKKRNEREIKCRGCYLRIFTSYFEYTVRKTNGRPTSLFDHKNSK